MTSPTDNTIIALIKPTESYVSYFAVDRSGEKAEPAWSSQGFNSNMDTMGRTILEGWGLTKVPSTANEDR